MSNVMVDTSVWIEYFKNSPNITGIIDDLLDKNQICITGPVIAELMQEVKTEKELKMLNTYIDAVPCVLCDIDDWRNAGMLSFEFRRKGKTIPLTDILIAAVSMRHGMSIFTFDAHFDSIPDVKLFHK